MRHSKVARRSLALAVLVLALGLQAQEVQLSSAERCNAYRIPERLQPAWTVSADWLKPDVLVVADSVGGKLLHYSPTGRFLGRDPEVLRKAVGQSEFKEFNPSGLVTASTNRPWIQMFGGRFVKVDNYQTVQDTLNLRDLSVGHDRKVAGLYDWTLAGEYLVAFGNLQDAAGTWSTGFFSVALSDEHKTNLITELPRYPPERVWYRLGYHYLTAIGDTAYGIKINEANERIEIVRIPPRGESIEALDLTLEALRYSPELHDYESPEEYAQLMEEVEKATMPTGIYGWQNDLYLVWRRRSSEHGQQWFLTKIEMSKGNEISRKNYSKVAGTMKLPYSSNHLMIVPGPKYWAVIEKGPVEGLGFQEERVLRFVPTPIIKSFNPGGTLCE